MAAPLTQPPIEPTDFDLFLTEIGLDILPQEEKDRIADQARSMTASLIVQKISQRLDDTQQDELAQLMEKAGEEDNYVALNEFMLKNMPDAQAITDDAIYEIKGFIRDSMRELPEMVEKKLDEQQKAWEDEQAVITKQAATSEKANNSDRNDSPVSSSTVKIYPAESPLGADSTDTGPDEAEEHLPAQLETESLDEAAAPNETAEADVAAPTQTNQPVASNEPSLPESSQPASDGLDATPTDPYAPFPWENQVYRQEDFEDLPVRQADPTPAATPSDQPLATSPADSTAQPPLPPPPPLAPAPLSPVSSNQDLTEPVDSSSDSAAPSQSGIAQELDTLNQTPLPPPAN